VDIVSIGRGALFSFRVALGDRDYVFGRPSDWTRLFSVPFGLIHLVHAKNMSESRDKVLHARRLRLNGSDLIAADRLQRRKMHVEIAKRAQFWQSGQSVRSTLGYHAATQLPSISFSDKKSGCEVQASSESSSASV
jgi:hypothetical protein